MKKQKFRIIRKDKFKEIVFQGIFSGFLVGFVFFILYLITDSFPLALKAGLSFWLTFFLFVFFALLIEEWKIRKKGYNKWQKNKYKKLKDKGLYINNELKLAGKLNHFEIYFSIKKEAVNKDEIIDKDEMEIYAIPDNLDKLHRFYGKAGRLPGIKRVKWRFGTIKIEFEDKFEDFALVLDKLLRFLTEEDFMPIGKNQKEKVFKEPVGHNKIAEENKKTQKLLESGELIKYVQSKLSELNRKTS